MVATPLVITGAAQLRLIWQKSGVDWANNVFGVGNSGAVAITQTVANTLDTAIKGFFTSSGWGAHVHSTFSLRTVAIRDINTASLAEFQGSGAGTAGTGTGDPLPYQTSLTVTLRTAKAGPSYRGRCFLCGVIEGDNDSTGQYPAAARTAAVAFVNGIGSALSSSGLQLAVLSRVHSTWEPVTTVLGRDLNWTVQRRRRTGI